MTAQEIAKLYKNQNNTPKSTASGVAANSSTKSAIQLAKENKGKFFGTQTEINRYVSEVEKVAALLKNSPNSVVVGEAPKTEAPKAQFPSIPTSPKEAKQGDFSPKAALQKPEITIPEEKTYVSQEIYDAAVKFNEEYDKAYAEQEKAERDQKRKNLLIAFNAKNGLVVANDPRLNELLDPNNPMLGTVGQAIKEFGAVPEIESEEEQENLDEAKRQKAIAETIRLKKFQNLKNIKTSNAEEKIITTPDGTKFYNKYAYYQYLDSQKTQETETRAFEDIRKNHYLASDIEQFAAKWASETFAKSKKLNADVHNIINGHKTVSVREDNYKYSKLTEEEKLVYNYYVMKQTKDMEGSLAGKYLKEIDSRLEARAAEDLAEEMNGLEKTVFLAGQGIEGSMYNIGRLGAAMKGQEASGLYDYTDGERLANEILKNEDNDFAKFFYQSVYTVSQQAPAIAMGVVSGGAGYSAMLTAGVMGDSIAEAMRNNKTLVEGVTYGAVQATMEIALDRLLGGIGGKFLGKGSSSKVVKVLNKIDNIFTHKFPKTLLKGVVVRLETGVGEGLQEFIQGVADPAIRNVIYEENNTYSADTLNESLYQGLIGMVSGFVLGGGNANEAQSQAYFESIGESVTTEEVLKLARDAQNIKSEIYREISEKVAKGKEVTAPERGQLSKETTDLVYNNSTFTKETLKYIATKGTEQQIAETMFGGNTEAAEIFKEKYSNEEFLNSLELNETERVGENFIAESLNPTEAVDVSSVNGYNNTSINLENGGFGNENVTPYSEERGQGGNTGERAGVLQADLGGNYDQGRTAWSEQGKSSPIRSGEGGRNRSITPEQTESLKSSAIKNEDGSPKAVYHFTDNMEFDVFAKGDIGFHFGNETQAAARGNIQNKTGRTITAYLDIKNPIQIPSDIMCWRPRNLAFRLVSDGIISERDFDTVSELDNTETYEYNSPAAVELRRILAEKGYDGIVYQNMFEGDGESYIAFYPEQVIIIDDGRGNVGSDTTTDAATDSLIHPAPTAGKIFKMNPVSAKARAFVKDIAKRLGTNLEFVDMAAELARRGNNTEGLIIYPEGFYDPDTHTLYIGNEVVNPVEVVFKHELTHYGERSAHYAEFAKAVRKSKAFKKWLEAQDGLKDISPKLRESKLHEIYRDRYKSLQELTEPKAQREVIAHFVAEVLFKGDVNTLSELLNESTPTHKNAIRRFLSDFFSYLKSKFSDSKQIVSEIVDLENMYRDLIADATANPTPTETGLTYDSAADTEAANEKTTEENGGEISYSVPLSEVRNWDINWDEDNNSSIKSQLINHMSEVNSMEPVAEVEFIKEANKTYADSLREFLLQNFGKKIQTKLYGDIIFDDEAINTLGGYINNDAEAAAALAAPYVIKKGKAISGHKNHKGKGSVSVTFAAPVQINGEVGNVAVSVLYGKGRVHSLRVLTPEGKTFELIKIKKEEATTAVRSLKTAGNPHITSSEFSIPQTDSNVKENVDEDLSFSIPAADSLYDKVQKGEITREEFDRLISEGWKKAGETYGVKPDGEMVTAQMSEADRAKILRAKKVNLVNVENGDPYNEFDFADLENNIKSKVEKSLLKKFQELGLLKKYKSVAISDVEFDFTGKGVRKSLNSQETAYGGSKADFAKAVIHLQELLDNSVLIETHTDKGKGTLKEQRGLKQVYVLLSVMREGNTVIPVQFEVKQYVDENNRLYLAVALTKIETGVVGNTASDKQMATSLIPISNISIPELFSKINPKDGKFLKYIPDEFLNASQIEAKKQALSDDETKYGLSFSITATERSGVAADTPLNRQTNYKAELGKLLQRMQNEEITQEEYMSEVSKLYQKSVDENGQIKQGEMVTPQNKPYPVPKKVREGTAVRGYVRTVMEAGKATPEIASHFEALILSGEFDHTPTSNEKRINAAVQKINNLGYQQALKGWRDQNKKLLTSDKNNIATGEALLNLAFEHKNVADIMNLTAELAEIGTRTAQNLQAMKLLKRMGGITQLIYVQKAVAKINENLDKRFKRRLESRGIPVPVVKINETMANQLAECNTESEYEVVYEAIMQDIADQVPPTFLDKFTAWRYMAMLFSTTTHIRNFFGNAIFLPAVRIKNVLGKVIELTQPKDQRTKSVVVKKAYKDFAEKDFEEVKDLLSGSGKYNPSEQIDEYRKIFKTRWLEALRKFNFTALEKEDIFFLKRHYRHSLGGYLQAQGLDVNNISSKKLHQARDYAIQEALKATYRDTSKVANVLSELSHISILGNIAIEGIMPFKKTPINIVKRGIEYSPAGLLKTVLDGIRLLRGGTITASEWIDGLASNLTGAGVFLFGMWLSSLGIVKAGFDDEEEWFRKMNGEQEYSIEIAGHSYTISWAAPMCIPFFMGAAVQEYDPEEDGDLFSAVGELMLSGFEPVLELSCLSGINDAIQGVKYVAEGEIPGLVMHSLKSFASQLLPTTLGKVANLFDDTRRTTYIDKTSDIPEIVQEALDKIASKFPGATHTRAEYIDAWGRKKYTGNFIERFFQQFVSPGYASTVEVSDISEELRRLYKVTGKTGIYPDTPKKYITIGGERRDLTKEEYYDYAVFAGQTKMDLVNDAMKHEYYDKLTDEQKAKVIGKIYEYSNKLAAVSQLEITLEEVRAKMGDKGDVLTADRWAKFTSEQKQYLTYDAFMDGVKTAYKYEQNGGSAAEYFIYSALKDN